jgi:hypothetical protein
MVCITANVLLSNGVAHLIDQVMNPHNDEEGYHDYELADDDQAAVPSFEGSALATATFSAVSGASDLKGLNMSVVPCFCGLAASVFSFFLV